MSPASKGIKRSLRSQVQIKEESDEEDNESYELEDSESEDPDCEEDSENEDPDYEEEIKKKKNIKKERLLKTTYPKIKRNLSTYEQMIQKNRAESKAFLRSLKIEEAKVELSKAVGSMKKIKKRRKPVKRKYKEEVSPPVLRKSRRLAKLEVDLSEEAVKEVIDRRRRRHRCGRCPACKRDNCERCRECLHRQEHGGLGLRRQCCVLRRCPFMQSLKCTS